MKKTLIAITLLITTNTYALDEVASSCEFNHINYKQAVSFINTFKAELEKNNKSIIANMASYPLTVNETVKIKSKEETRHRSIKDKQEFIKEYDSIFTENMRMSILEDQEPIFCNYQGAMIAHGIIWFNTENDKAAFLPLIKNNIFAI